MSNSFLLEQQPRQTNEKDSLQGWKNKIIFAIQKLRALNFTLDGSFILVIYSYCC